MPNRPILLSKLRSRPPLSIRRRRKDFEREKRSFSFASYDFLRCGIAIVGDSYERSEVFRTLPRRIVTIAPQTELGS